MSEVRALPALLRRELAQAGARPDEDVDPIETALLLATATRPGIGLDPYRRHLAKLGEEAARHAGRAPSLDMQIESLREVVAKRYGYVGTEDAFDDLEAANLTRVVDRRNGLPVALGIIYLGVGRALGWALVGIDFPGRFLLRVEHGGRRVLLDPFDALRIVTPADARAVLKAVAGNEVELSPSHFSAMSMRAVLLRLQNNVKTRLIAAEQFAEALFHVELMLLIAPEAGPLWHEAGVLNARLDNVKAAVAALEESLRREAGDRGRYRTSLLLKELRARLN